MKFLTVLLTAAFAMLIFGAYGFISRPSQEPQYDVVSYNETSYTLYIEVIDDEMISGSDMGAKMLANMLANILENPSIDWIVIINQGFVPTRTYLIDRSWVARLQNNNQFFDQPDEGRFFLEDRD